MARYEEARFLYRKAVLASLDGTSKGQAIRQAIRVFQSAKAELNRLPGPPPPPRGGAGRGGRGASFWFRFEVPPRSGPAERILPRLQRPSTTSSRSPVTSAGSSSRSR